MAIGCNGPACDICGKYILPLPGNKVHSFKLQCCPDTLIADTKCFEALTEAQKDDNYRKLPDGPLKNELRLALIKAAEKAGDNEKFQCPICEELEYVIESDTADREIECRACQHRYKISEAKNSTFNTWQAA